VILPKELVGQLKSGKLLAEEEWRRLGVQQSRGWEHYAVHRPEPHILLFRRLLGTDPNTGKCDRAAHEEASRKVRAEYEQAGAR